MQTNHLHAETWHSEVSDIQLYQEHYINAPDFHYARWASHLQHWRRKDASGTDYAPFGSFSLVEVTNTQLVGLKRNISSLLIKLSKAVDKVLESKSMFFRLATRSPKDAWQRLAPELGIADSDTACIRQAKLQAQMRLCLVQNFDDVRKLVLCSERLQEDLDYQIEHAPEHDVMNLIFVTWRDIAREVRLFVVDKRLLEACPYQPTIWLKEDVSKLQDQRDLLQAFVHDILEVLPSLYFTAVIDVWLDDKDRVHLIELNPFDEMTDPILYTWDHLHDLARYSKTDST